MLLFEPARTPDPAAYRQMLRIAFNDVWLSVARAGRSLEVTDGAAHQGAVELLGRRVKDLRRLVEALGGLQQPGEPAIAGELHNTYAVALTAVEERLRNNEHASAHRLARHLIDLIAVELSWMPKP
jgi:hypothetical protein